MKLLAPMLAEPLPQSKLEKLLASDRWRAEPKVDGDRLLIHVVDGRVIPVNRKGETTTLPNHSMKTAFESLTTGEWAFDGEAVGRDFYVWDMPVAGSAVDPSTPFETRRAVLETFMGQWDVGENVHLIASFLEEAEKRALYQRVLDHGGEGIMLKDVGAPYASGKRSDRMKKVKFWKSCEVIVADKGIEGKENALMVMICPGNCEHTRCNGRLEVGTISTIGKGPIAIGDVVEVKFLYCVNRDSPKLVQPTILKKRLDKGMEECTVDQLDGCFTNKTVVEVVK